MEHGSFSSMMKMMIYLWERGIFHSYVKQPEASNQGMIGNYGDNCNDLLE